MPRLLSAEPWRLVPLSLLVVLPLIISGCGGNASASQPSTSGSSASPASATEDRAYIATAIALKAAEGGTSAARPAATPGPRTVAEISASAPTSGLLESKHLAAGKGCDSCHGAMPAEGKPSAPTTTKCLSCHGGSWESLIAKTSSLGSRNPHKAHTGRQDCDRCHHVHRPFEFSCNSCHTFATPDRFKATTPSTSAASTSAPAGSAGEAPARQVETED